MSPSDPLSVQVEIDALVEAERLFDAALAARDSAWAAMQSAERELARIFLPADSPLGRVTRVEIHGGVLELSNEPGGIRLGPDDDIPGGWPTWAPKPCVRWAGRARPTAVAADLAEADSKAAVHEAQADRADEELGLPSALEVNGVEYSVELELAAGDVKLRAVLTALLPTIENGIEFAEERGVIEDHDYKLFARVRAFVEDGTPL